MVRHDITITCMLHYYITLYRRCNDLLEMCFLYGNSAGQMRQTKVIVFMIMQMFNPKYYIHDIVFNANRMISSKISEVFRLNVRVNMW